MKYKVNGKEPKIGKRNFLAPTCVLIGDVSTGENVSIWFGAVLRGDSNKITIGNGSSVQDNVSIHVEYTNETKIGENVTIGHNCVIHGCKIGDNSLIGMGTIILTGTKIPKNSLVAAGSLVNSRLEAQEGSFIAGNPAKVVKLLDDRYIKMIKESSDEYLDRLAQYEKGFCEVK